MPICLPDSSVSTANPGSDSLKVDSNYLPVTKSAIKNKVKYSAKDSIVYSSSSKSATLYTNAQINFEEYEMKSAIIRIDLGKSLVNASGIKDSLGKLLNTPAFKQGSSEYKIEEVTFNYQTKRGLMREFRTQEGEGFIKGEKVKRDEFSNFYIRNSHYTTCSEDEPHFSIKASKLKVIPGERVITGPANLTIANVRTPLFVPFGIFPLKRGQQSGVIIPSYGNATGRGFFLRQGGFYFGLGGQADLALLGDIYTNLSYMVGGRMNYNRRYHFNGLLNANFAHNINGLPEDRNYNAFNTFNINWMHSMDPKARPGTNFRADVNLVGNQYLAFNTYNTNNTAFNNNINSSVSFSKSFKQGKYNLSSSARASQNTQTRDLAITLPDLTFTVASFQPFKPKWKPTAETWYEKISVNYMGQMQNLLNTKDTMLFRPRTNEAMKSYLDSVMRNGAQHAITVQNSFNVLKYYTVSVGGDYREAWTIHSVNKTFDESTKKVVTDKVSGFDRYYQYSLRGGISTRYYGMVQFKKSRLKAIRHVINPDLSFSYMPDFSDAKYGFYRTVKSDTLGNTQLYNRFENALYSAPGRGRQGNINFGIDNNLEIKWAKGKDTSEKVEKVKIFESLRAGGSYNVFADSMNLSVIPISFRTTLFKTIGINGSANLDPYVNEVVDRGGYKYYQRVNRFYFNDFNKLGVITNANMGVSAALTPDMFKSKDEKLRERRKKEMTDQQFTELNLNWSLSFSYTVTYDYRSKIDPKTPSLIQTLSFNGTFSPSKGWGMNFNSGYDFRLGRISHLGVDLKRDLHCWQFSFAWTPLSAYGNQYFIFNLNVKSSVLHDLKIPKRKDWFDNRRI